MKLLITQSNYIPWKGYFDSIHYADEVIFYDHVQYTKRDWRNRNLIRTKLGTEWLSIPVEVKGKFTQRICDTLIADKQWNRRHWNIIQHNYSRAGSYKEVQPFLEELYMKADYKYLTEVNYHFIQAICDYLGIPVRFGYSQQMRFAEGKNESLIELCLMKGATEYLTGPAARSYLDEKLFNQNGIKVIYLDYSGYREYTQVHPGFEHGVSIIDLLLNEGKNATAFMKSFKSDIHETA